MLNKICSEPLHMSTAICMYTLFRVDGFLLGRYMYNVRASRAHIEGFCLLHTHWLCQCHGGGRTLTMHCLNEHKRALGL